MTCWDHVTQGITRILKHFLHLASRTAASWYSFCLTDTPSQSLWQVPPRVPNLLWWPQPISWPSQRLWVLTMPSLIYPSLTFPLTPDLTKRLPVQSPFLDVSSPTWHAPHWGPILSLLKPAPPHVSPCVSVLPRLGTRVIRHFGRVTEPFLSL